MANMLNKVFSFYSYEFLAHTENFISSDDSDKPDDFMNLLEHRHPNSLRIDDDRLYVGDSLGLIHVFGIQVNISCLI